MSLSVSIIIPCKNEEQYIGRCLDSILKQDYPSDKTEVLVCDGLSTDHTVNEIKKYTQQHGNIRLIINEQQTAPFAFNLGIKRSSSDVVIILGAHSELYPNYVSACIHCLEKFPEAGCTGGIIENIYENDTAEAIGKAMSSPFGVGNAHFRTGARDGFVDTVAFGAYKREVFQKAGYFDEALIRNQDDEFNFRLIKSGYKIFLSKEIRSKYYVRASLSKLMRQYFQYGYWKVCVSRKHRTVTTGRQLVPALFVLFLLAYPFMYWASVKLFVLFSCITGMYLLLAFALAAASASRITQIHKILISFFILHWGYGLGYLSGLIDFIVLGKPIKKQETITR